MKITVELDDFWYNGREEKLEEALQNKVIREVKNAIWDEIKEMVETQIKEVALANVKERWNDKIKEEMAVILKTEEFKGKKLNEWVLSKFSDTRGYNNLETKIKELGEGYVKKLKDRYDMVFATQVITKMREQKMLKDDVASALFDIKKGDSDE